MTGSGSTLEVPRAALFLGAAGLIPFVCGALGLWVFDSAVRIDATLTLFLGYSAVILSFMGAIHWGLAMAGACAPTSPTRAMTLSVLPALIAWLALALPAAASCAVFAFGFAAIYVIDEFAIRRGHAPRWYRRLRLPLTSVVIACQLAALTAITLLRSV